MKQYCLKLDDWLVKDLEDYIRKYNESRHRWNWINRNRLFNKAIEAYIKKPRE
jgi:hypothetical protein